MKKVGLVSFQNADNYGALLQIYATQTILKREGYNIEIINYDNKIISGNYKVMPPVTINPIKYLRRLYFSLLRIKTTKERIKNFNRFREEYLELTKLYNKKDIKNTLNYYDILLTGSDQVWNPKFTKKLDEIYTLDFGSDKVKRISVAASAGDATQIVKYKEDYISKLKKIDYISVRESKTAKALEKILNKKIFTLLDPSLLLSKEEWINAFDTKPLVNYKYILAYNAGGADGIYYDAINYLGHKTGYKIIYLDSKEDKIIVDKESKWSSSPDQFVNLIYNAEIIITSSFHGLAFSLNLNKKVMVVPGWVSERIDNILDILDKKDLIVKNIDDVKKIFSSKIDWKNMNDLLEKERNKCLTWLHNSLRNKEDD